MKYRKTLLSKEVQRVIVNTLAGFKERYAIEVSTIDALIAAVAISYSCYLFTTDKDFEHIAQHSKLKLFKIRQIEKT